MEERESWMGTVERFVHLTERERDERARSLAGYMQELIELKSAKSAALREFSDRISNHGAAVLDYTDRVQRGVEKRVCACNVYPDWQRGTATLIDVETGEIIGTRPLTEEERMRQYELPLGEN